MARTHDFCCDVSGETIARLPVPIVITITAAVVPGAEVDPPAESLPPLVRALLFEADGSPRRGPSHGRIELSAAEFERCVTVDMEKVAPAFE